MISLTLDVSKLETLISNQFQEFIGLSFDEISYSISLNPELVTNKASIVTIVNRMLDYKNVNKKQLADEILPKQLSIKTVRLKSNGNARESMSFEQVRFMEIVEESWQFSKLRKKFVDTIFLFFVFQYKERADGQILVFKGTKIWQMPQETLEVDVKRLWETTREIVMNGVKFKEKIVGNKIYRQNNLPGLADTAVAHIRPKASDSNDKVELPDGQMITKQAYWLNASYIGEILQDLPEVNLKKSKQVKSHLKFSREVSKRLKAKLEEQVYPVEEFIIKVKQVKSDFTEMDVTHEFVSKIGFKLNNRFVISEEIESIDQYIDKIVFNSHYFQIPKNPFFQSPYVMRKIENFENDFRLLKIEENLYITNASLRNGGVTKENLMSYKDSVERFVEDGKFFTLRYIEDNGFYHELMDYGFEEIFYQSILMRPGRLKYLKIAKQVVFIKSKLDVTVNDLMAYLLQDNQSITVEKLIERSQSLCQLDLDYDHAIKLMKNTTYFYSEDLLKLYEDQEIYYKEIYK